MNKKIIILNLIILVAVFMLGIQVNATDTTFKLQIKESENAINYGDEISFTIGIAELQKGEAIGTNAITAKIEYDSNVLEYEDYTTNNKWTMTSLNENNMTFAMTNSKYIAENQDIVTFKFKAKTNINATSTTVYLKNISAGFRMSEEDVTKTSTIKATDVSKTIQLSKKQSESENTISDQNTIQSENTISNQNAIQSENTISDQNIVPSQNTIAQQNTVAGENTSSTQNTIQEENVATNETVNNSLAENENNDKQNNTAIAKTNTNTNSDTSATNKILPATGVKNILLIIVCILAIIVGISVVTYYRYKKIIR